MLNPVLKAIIIEDEPKAAQLLELMLIAVDPSTVVVDICYDLPSGVRSIKKLKPDIIFLDIEMPGYSGLRLLEFFDKDEVNFGIVFTTAFNNYAIKAFELSAIDYLLKPLQEDKLLESINKFRKRNVLSQPQQIAALKHNLQSTENRKIAIPVANGLEIIKVHDLVYFEAEGSYTKIHIRQQQPILVSKKLKYFEDLLLEDPMFIRCHRSYMVNLQSIKKFVKSDGGNLILEDGKVLPISVEKVEEIVTALNQLSH